MPWTSPTSPSGDYFATLDLVTFDNNAVATSVSLSGTLIPDSITVTGTQQFHVFRGGRHWRLDRSDRRRSRLADDFQHRQLLQRSHAGPRRHAGSWAQTTPCRRPLRWCSAAAPRNGTFDLAGFSQTRRLAGHRPVGRGRQPDDRQQRGFQHRDIDNQWFLNLRRLDPGRVQRRRRADGLDRCRRPGVPQRQQHLHRTDDDCHRRHIAARRQLRALGAGANAGNLVANGLLDLAGYHATVNTLSGSGTVGDSGGGGSLTFGNNASSTFSGLLTGGNNTNLTKNGAGTFVLTGTNVVANTMINQGTYQIGNGVLNGSAGSATQYNIAPVRGSISTKAPAPTPPSPGAASPAAGRSSWATPSRRRRGIAITAR